MTALENTDGGFTPHPPKPKKPKVRVDQNDLTFAELADIEEKLGTSLSSLFQASQARGMAAIVWVTIRRDNPEFTYEEALQLGPGQIEDVTDEGEADAATGGTPQPSLAFGNSTPVT